jgi:hypothetical protein
MAEKPNIPVLPWPAVATPTPDEVYQGESDQKKEYALWLESALRQSENFKKPDKFTGTLRQAHGMARKGS